MTQGTWTMVVAVCLLLAAVAGYAGADAASVSLLGDEERVAVDFEASVAPEGVEDEPEPYQQEVFGARFVGPNETVTPESTPDAGTDGAVGATAIGAGNDSGQSVPPAEPQTSTEPTPTETKTPTGTATPTSTPPAAPDEGQESPPATQTGAGSTPQKGSSDVVGGESDADNEETGDAGTPADPGTSSDADAGDDTATTEPPGIESVGDGALQADAGGEDAAEPSSADGEGAGQ